ncbi:glycosyltransferase [Paenalcaligenes hominis]|uniref:YkoP family protein n=1 Tax=Paenalcaligenes hominis TaxID=643674 RepID=UPI003525EF52
MKAHSDKSEPAFDAKKPRPRVLLLTSTLGSGHLRATQAVDEALRARCPNVVIQTLDFWSLLDAPTAHTLRQTYLWLAQERPDLYEQLYQLDQYTWRNIIERHEPLPAVLVTGIEWLAASADSAAAVESNGTAHLMDRAVFRLFRLLLAKRVRHIPENGLRVRLASFLIRWNWARIARRLYTQLKAFAPDVVVATQMIPAALFSSVKVRYGLNVPALGVLTDYGMHDVWLQPGLNNYCLPHELITTKWHANPKATPPAVFGIPLMSKFNQLPSQDEARAQLHLDSGAPVILALGGGLGLGIDTVAARLLANTKAQVLVLAGQNAEALATLNKLVAHYPDRLSVWGWTDNIEVFLRAADVVVGKPGGLTVAEVLACGRPLLATCCLRGQESFNVRFIEEHKVGRLVHEDELCPAVEALFADPAALADMQARAWALGRREGAAGVAEAALTFAQSHTPQQPDTPRLEWLRQIAQRCLGNVDKLYHRWHGLQPIGEVLYVGRTRYRGPAMTFADGTQLKPGDFMGTLHLNNARFPDLEADTSIQAALRFTRLMLASMRILAEQGHQNPHFSELTVYNAVSWLGPHGAKVGFQTQPVPPGPRKYLSSLYFRLLVWAFAPAQETRASANPEPTIYWLTREQLLQRFGRAALNPNAGENE